MRRPPPDTPFPPGRLRARAAGAAGRVESPAFRAAGRLVLRGRFVATAAVAVQRWGPGWADLCRSEGPEFSALVLVGGEDVRLVIEAAASGVAELIEE
jgi:hypothetical protein